MALDALEFLQNLIARSARPDKGCLSPAPSVSDPTPADLPSDFQLFWEERAAIRVYDGGMAREQAEAEALAETLRVMREQGITLRSGEGDRPPDGQNTYLTTRMAATYLLPA